MPNYYGDNYDSDDYNSDNFADDRRASRSTPYPEDRAPRRASPPSRSTPPRSSSNRYSDDSLSSDSDYDSGYDADEPAPRDLRSSREPSREREVDEYREPPRKARSSRPRRETRETAYEDESGYDDYEDNDPSNRLRSRFQQFERGRRSYDSDDELTDDDGARQEGCQRYSAYGCMFGVLLIALFRGGIFNGEVALPRRGCQWIMTLAVVGFLMVSAGVVVSNNEGDPNTVAFLVLCGSGLCVASGGGFIMAFLMGTKFLAISGLIPDNRIDGEGGGGLLGGLGGGFMDMLGGRDNDRL